MLIHSLERKTRKKNDKVTHAQTKMMQMYILCKYEHKMN